MTKMNQVTFKTLRICLIIKSKNLFYGIAAFVAPLDLPTTIANKACCQPGCYKVCTIKRLQIQCPRYAHTQCDRVELRVYVLVKTAAGSPYVQYCVSKYTCAQTYPLVYIPLYLSDSGWKFTYYLLLTLNRRQGQLRCLTGAFMRPG